MAEQGYEYSLRLYWILSNRESQHTSYTKRSFCQIVFMAQKQLEDRVNSFPPRTLSPVVKVERGEGKFHGNCYGCRDQAGTNIKSGPDRVPCMCRTLCQGRLIGRPPPHNTSCSVSTCVDQLFSSPPASPYSSNPDTTIPTTLNDGKGGGYSPK